jgi:hypothetical protein
MSGGIELRGTLEFVPVGTGAWRLRLEGGEEVQLLGADLARLAGRRVRVSGAWFEGMTLGMVGQRTLRVVQIAEEG